MRRLVVDAKVIASWFSHPNPRLRDEYEAGALIIFAPPSARLELIDLLAALASGDIDELISAIDHLRFELVEPPTNALGRWIRRGLRAAAASYAALAEVLEVPLVTVDPELLAAAGPVIIKPPGISGYPT